jgi:DNA-binding protein HU-beta
MNKSEFAKELAARAELTGVQGQKVTDEFLGLLTEAIAKGERVAFLGFGTFSTSKRAARTGVNPRNPGQKVKIPARTAVKFTPGAPLKAAANTGKVAKKAAPAAKKPAAKKPAAKKPAATKAAPKKK